jgi:hypothetical protein
MRQALLDLDWPAPLLSTKAAGEVWGGAPQPSEQPEMLTLDDSTSTATTEMQQSALFRGLRVRMGVHTGSNCSMSRHPVTGGSPRASQLQPCGLIPLNRLL